MKITLPAANMMILNTTPPENACSNCCFVPFSVPSCSCTAEGLHTALTKSAEQNIARVPTLAVLTTSSLRNKETESHPHLRKVKVSLQSLLLSAQNILVVLVSDFLFVYFQQTETGASQFFFFFQKSGYIRQCSAIIQLQNYSSSLHFNENIEHVILYIYRYVNMVEKCPTSGYKQHQHRNVEQKQREQQQRPEAGTAGSQGLECPGGRI